MPLFIQKNRKWKSMDVMSGERGGHKTIPLVDISISLLSKLLMFWILCRGGPVKGIFLGNQLSWYYQGSRLVNFSESQSKGHH